MHLPRYLVATWTMLRTATVGQGIGSALVERAIEWARSAGAHKIALQHWPHNTAARARDHKYGFEQEGYLRRDHPRRTVSSGTPWSWVCSSTTE